jgi:hypothetical protein
LLKLSNFLALFFCKNIGKINIKLPAFFIYYYYFLSGKLLNELHFANFLVFIFFALLTNGIGAKP